MSLSGTSPSPPTSPARPARTRRRKAVEIAVSLVLTALLLALFFRNVRLDELRAAFSAVDARLLAAAVAVCLAALGVRALRWHVILRPLAPISIPSLYAATAIGFMATTLLPARAGEIVRPLVLARRERLPPSAAIASIVVERVLDLLAVIGFFVGATLLAPLPLAGGESQEMARMLRASGWTAALAGLAGVGALVLLARHEERCLAFAARLLRRAPQRFAAGALALATSFLAGFRVLRQWRAFTATLGLTVVLWLLLNVQTWLVLLAFAIPLPFSATFVLTAVGVIGLALPTPGGVGGYHAVIQAAMVRLFAIAPSAAASFAIAAHAVGFLPPTLVGLALLPFYGISLGGVGRLAAPERQ